MCSLFRNDPPTRHAQPIETLHFSLAFLPKLYGFSHWFKKPNSEIPSRPPFLNQLKKRNLVYFDQWETYKIDGAVHTGGCAGNAHVTILTENTSATSRMVFAPCSRQKSKNAPSCTNEEWPEQMTIVEGKAPPGVFNSPGRDQD